jgi:hypothetical protein
MVIGEGAGRGGMRRSSGGPRGDSRGGYASNGNGRSHGGHAGNGSHAGNGGQGSGGAHAGGNGNGNHAGGSHRQAPPRPQGPARDGRSGGGGGGRPPARLISPKR